MADNDARDFAMLEQMVLMDLTVDNVSAQVASQAISNLRRARDMGEAPPEYDALLDTSRHELTALGVEHA